MATSTPRPRLRSLPMEVLTERIDWLEQLIDELTFGGKSESTEAAEHASQLDFIRDELARRAEVA